MEHLLRVFFNEPERVDEGYIKEANLALRRFIKLLERRYQDEEVPYNLYHRLEVRTRGLEVSLDEFEQSKFASTELRKRIHSVYLEDMSDEELKVYRQHVYFYKNALVRSFSVLDKLGHFLNEILNVKTEKVKAKFSYFTVLRHLERFHSFHRLHRDLIAVKETYKEPLYHLRKLRNLEIHFLNAEMLDDLFVPPKKNADRTEIENLEKNMIQLEQGFEMVCLTVKIAFEHCVSIKRWGQGSS